MEQNRYYVYHLIDPILNRVFYVGKGVGNRCYSHLSGTHNKRLWGYINNIRKKGVEPIVIKIQENLSEDYSYDLETLEIKKYGRKGIDDGGILMNIAGEGNRPPALFGEMNSFYGRHHTEETKKILSDKKLGTKHTEETRKKMSESHTGVSKSEETKKKMSEKATGRVHTEETKQKLREHNLQEDVLRKNIESKQKEWIVITPDGTEIEVINMSEYCLANGLSRSKMYSVAAGDRNHHKGYKCRKKNE